MSSRKQSVLKHCGGTRPTYELLETLVTFLLEVQVVEDGLFALGLREGSEDDRHVEFTPSLLLNSEGSLLYACIFASTWMSFQGRGSKLESKGGWRTLCGTLAERLVQTVGDLLETGGR
jgi:hypothetical protein